MSRCGTLSAVLLLFLLATATVAASEAAAEPGPLRLVSRSEQEQADLARATALSSDGRYLAFEGEIGGLEGVFREDLQSGEIAAVAAGSVFAPEAITGSSAPAISADGRYVSFTTTAQLGAGDPQASSSDVYVADMSAAPEPTYELASALDGSSEGLSYEGAGGSLASGRVALSADGREVVFVTTAKSNLGGSPGDTPAGQVVLRSLETLETTLVSAARDPGTGLMTTGPVLGGAVVANAPSLRGAALSADGTTVAWLGAHLPAQVPLLSDERTEIERLDSVGLNYYEPLWRRVADGPEAPTRRIVGGGDPAAPGCPPDGTLADPACRGPFPAIYSKSTDFVSTAGAGWLGVPAANGVPVLSTDGREVALIGDPELVTDVFVVDMDPGLSRSEAVRPLTRAPIVDATDPGGTIDQPPFIPINGHIRDIALSADGDRIAFTTSRQQFPLAPPNLVGSAPSSVAGEELYLIDLERGTLQRLTHGVGGSGEASLGGGASSPSLSADGGRIAFSSGASNLVAGDANGASDAFVVDAPSLAPQPGVNEIAAPPPPTRFRPQWRLVLRAASLADGSVRVFAVVPAPGTLAASVAGSLVPGGRQHRVASGSAQARAAGPVTMTLKLPARLRRASRSQGGLYASAHLVFRPTAGKTLKGKLEVRFRAPSKGRAGRGGGR